MKCPSCGRKNADSAMWCECGYDFTVGDTRLPDADLPEESGRVEDLEDTAALDDLRDTVAVGDRYGRNYDKGLSLWRNHEYERAIPYLRKALEYHIRELQEKNRPPEAAPFQILADCWVETRKSDEALKVLERFDDCGGDKDLFLDVRLRIKEGRGENVKELKAKLKRKKEPDAYWESLERADGFIEREKFSDAWPKLDRAIALGRKGTKRNHDAYARMGLIKEKRKLYKDAAIMFLHACQNYWEVNKGRISKEYEDQFRRCLWAAGFENLVEINKPLDTAYQKGIEEAKLALELYV